MTAVQSQTELRLSKSIDGNGFGRAYLCWALRRTGRKRLRPNQFLRLSLLSVTSPAADETHQIRSLQPACSRMVFKTRFHCSGSFLGGASGAVGFVSREGAFTSARRPPAAPRTPTRRQLGGTVFAIRICSLRNFSKRNPVRGSLENRCRRVLFGLVSPARIAAGSGW